MKHQTNNVIPFPAAAKPQAIGALDEIKLSDLRLSRRTFNRLAKCAKHWSVSIEAAAEMLLACAVNEVMGVKRR